MRAEHVAFMGRAKDRSFRGPLGGGGLHVLFPATQTSVRRALSTAMSALRGFGVDDDTRATAEIVLAEALNNVVEHAYEDRGHGIIELEAWRDGRILRFRLRDDGLPMPGNVIPERLPSDILIGTADLPEGGFGWSLIRDLTVDLAYHRDGTRNELCFGLSMSPV
ncbi:ATP-binding protein [uncultured Maritimibacter sp.]|uniref:ATP-binding protein n=1 Tax=uncultured Maritimibacter sp. TaxID=991866 RepID=UPI00261E2A0F|nr:ATP-binding protein [uncultured Maritimibacter sp.]